MMRWRACVYRMACVCVAILADGASWRLCVVPRCCHAVLRTRNSRRSQSGLARTGLLAFGFWLFWALID